MVDEVKAKKQRQRNPLFPSISLKKALDRARVLYDNESRKSMRLDTATKHWGYSAKSSGAQQSISALKQFGLLEDEKVGDVRKVQLSELALSILLDKREESKDRSLALRQAALKPRIYAELWAKADENGGLPSDTELEHYLVLERKQPFFEDAVEGLIKDFKSAIALAKLVENDIIRGSEGGPKAVEVGCYVQWTSQGALQFEAPCKVLGLSEDGEWAFVEGSETGLPVKELDVVEAPVESSGSAPLNPLYKPLETGGAVYIDLTLPGGNVVSIRAKSYLTKSEGEKIKSLVDLSLVGEDTDDE